MSDLKILLFDIECSPALSYHYGLWDQNISTNSIVEEPRIIAFSAKWYKTGRTMFYSEFHHSRKEMLKALYDLLDEADVVVGWNSQRFDVPWVNSELILEGYTPPSPFKHLDLNKISKSQFRFISQKLDYVSKRLLDDKKINYSMLRMWTVVNNPETPDGERKKEWNAMKRYAIKDTRLLEPILDKFLPWIKMPHPIVSGDNLCRNCGSGDLQRRGFARTFNGSYQRYWCRKCGAWSRGLTRTPDTNMRNVS